MRKALLAAGMSLALAAMPATPERVWRAIHGK